MDSRVGKRYTRIDFSRLRSNPRHESGVTVDTIQESAVPDEYALDKRQKHVQLPSENKGNADATGLRALRLPQIIQSGVEEHIHSEVQHCSPWEKYEKSHDVRLGVSDYVTIGERGRAESKLFTRGGPLSNLVLVKEFRGIDAEIKFRAFRQFQHANLLCALEVFRFDETYYMVFEYMVFSLYYVAGNPRIDDIRLAALLGQTLKGVTYLESVGLEHELLNCSNILIHPRGDVKIAGLDSCRSRSYDSAKTRHTKALSKVAMELMQGYSKEDEAVGVEDLDRWPSDSDAVNFLSTTVTAASVTELMKHPLLRLPWRKEMLQGLVSFVTVGTRIGQRYPPR